MNYFDVMFRPKGNPDNEFSKRVSSLEARVLRHMHGTDCLVGLVAVADVPETDRSRKAYEEAMRLAVHYDFASVKAVYPQITEEDFLQYRELQGEDPSDAKAFLANRNRIEEMLAIDDEPELGDEPSEPPPPQAERKTIKLPAQGAQAGGAA